MLRGCDLDDATLAALVTTGALAPHLGELRMITLHENNPQLRALPPELLTATLQHITVAGPAGSGPRTRRARIYWRRRCDLKTQKIRLQAPGTSIAQELHHKKSKAAIAVAHTWELSPLTSPGITSIKTRRIERTQPSLLGNVVNAT